MENSIPLTRLIEAKGSQVSFNFWRFKMIGPLLSWQKEARFRKVIIYFGQIRIYPRLFELHHTEIRFATMLTTKVNPRLQT